MESKKKDLGNDFPGLKGEKLARGGGGGGGVGGGGGGHEGKEYANRGGVLLSKLKLGEATPKKTQTKKKEN